MCSLYPQPTRPSPVSVYETPCTVHHHPGWLQAPDGALPAVHFYASTNLDAHLYGDLLTLGRARPLFSLIYFVFIPFWTQTVGFESLVLRFDRGQPESNPIPRRSDCLAQIRRRSGASSPLSDSGAAAGTFFRLVLLGSGIFFQVVNLLLDFFFFWLQIRFHFFLC